MFGVTEGAVCPRGAVAEVQLTEKEASEIYKKYLTLFEKES